MIRLVRTHKDVESSGRSSRLQVVDAKRVELIPHAGQGVFVHPAGGPLASRSEDDHEGCQGCHQDVEGARLSQGGKGCHSVGSITRPHWRCTCLKEQRSLWPGSPGGNPLPGSETHSMPSARALPTCCHRSDVLSEPSPLLCSGPALLTSFLARQLMRQKPEVGMFQLSIAYVRRSFAV